MKLNMTREEKKTLCLTSLICLMPILAGIALYSKMPDTVVTHWDAAGEPNGWSPKWLGTLVFPGMLLLLNFLTPLLLRLDPRRANMDGRLRAIVQWIIPLCSVFCSGMTLTAALGRENHIARLGPMFLGVILILIGNLLPKTGQSRTLGIRVPWTLRSEENWRRTHRFGGFVFVIAGFIDLMGGLLGCPGMCLIGVTVAAALLPAVYSYLLYRKGI